MNPAELFRRDEDVLRLNEGQVLFRTGDPARDMYVLLDGKMDIVVGEHVVEEAGTGALLGEMALVTSAPRAATVLARTPCRLARIDKARFHYLVQQNPFFATHVMKVLVQRLRHMDEALARS